jgi:hypothetical protein
MATRRMKMAIDGLITPMTVALNALAKAPTTSA